MTTFWIYDWKGKLTTLSQYVLSKNAYNVLAIYSGKNTVVISKNSFLPTYKIWPGMIIVKVTTSKGDLLWTY